MSGKPTGAKNLEALAKFARVNFPWGEKVVNGVAKESFIGGDGFVACKRKEEFEEENKGFAVASMVVFVQVFSLSG